MINRRTFMAGLGAVSGLLVLGAGASSVGANPRQLYASSGRNKKSGKNFAVIFSLDSPSSKEGELASVELPGRAHEISPHPLKTECVAVGRRPARLCVVFGPHQKPHWFHAREDRHFQGHGVFSPDGRLFYTTENDYDGERGMVGVRDARDDYKQIGEFPSHGIGPHEMSITDKGQTLVINNGGILTHPDMGRQKLNLDEMEPSLVYMDAKTGALKEKRSLAKDQHQVSIRHFAIAPDGTVVFGGQHNGSKSERPPLIGFHRRGEEIEMVKAPKSVQRAMRNYVGSIAIDSAGTIAAASCPRGNLVTFWDIRERRLFRHWAYEADDAGKRASGYGDFPLKDGCGVAANGKDGGFVLTSGLGEVGDYSTSDEIFITTASAHLSEFAWDNHLSRLHS